MCLNLGIWTFIKARAAERASRRALGIALTLTGGVAALKANYASIDPWLALVPIWVSAFIHFIDPDTDISPPQEGQPS
jgi:hypothetical protein